MSAGPSYLDFITPNFIFSLGPAWVKAWQDGYAEKAKKQAKLQWPIASSQPLQTKEGEGA